jgi:hypothetical protein
VAVLLAALLPEVRDQRLHRGGLLRDGEQRAGARHDLAAGGGPGGDPLGGGGRGHRGPHPVPPDDVNGLRVPDDRHVDDPFEQHRLGAEPHVDGARADLGAPGDRFQRRGRIAVGEEELGRRGEDPLFGLRDLGFPQGWPGGRRAARIVRGVDFTAHSLQYNCNECIMTA